MMKKKLLPLALTFVSVTGMATSVLGERGRALTSRELS